MYEKVEKDNVLTELNNGADMYIVDIPTRRVMRCAEMKMDAIQSFRDKAETMFFKALTNG